MRRSLVVLAVVMAGCRSGPLRDIESGERRGGRDEVDTKKTVAAGSTRDLACQVRWSDAPIHTKVDAAWWFSPAKGGEKKKIHGAERWTRESTGKWFTHVDTTSGWEAGTYTCEFSVGAQKRTATITVK